MAHRPLGAVLLLSVIVPLLVSTIILIVVVMVLPNSDAQTEVVSQDTQLTGSKDQQQVSPPSYQTKSRVLFISGIVFGFGLFVFLIVIIVAVCIWARKSEGYVVSNQDCEATKQVYADADCQLTKHTEKVNDSNQAIESVSTKKGNVESTTLAALPSLPVRTVAVPTQVAPKNPWEKGVDDDCLRAYNSSVEDNTGAQPKRYGTLGRTHLLSSTDEDGYYIDNLGFDSEEANTEEFMSLDERQSSSSVYQNSSPGVIRESVNTTQPTTAEEQGARVSQVTEVDCSDYQDNPSPKPLSKQDSFQGLPPLRSFDRYLTLVRLDSDVSLESYSLEEIKKIWQSIDEDNEEEEVKTNVREKETED